jgi:hypothetical protein
MRDVARFQAEALFKRAEGQPRSGFTEDDIIDPDGANPGNYSRSTLLQGKALKDAGDPSQPIAPRAPVDTSKVKARRSDLRKHPATLSAELSQARQNGDEVRATELTRAQGVLQLGYEYAERVGINEDE